MRKKNKGGVKLQKNSLCDTALTDHAESPIKTDYTEAQYGK